MEKQAIDILGPVPPETGSWEMRKIIMLAGAAVVFLLCIFCSCGDESMPSPSERADKMVDEWDRAALNLYRYSGRAIDYDGHAGYMVVMTPADSFPDADTLRDYQTPETSRQCAATVYEQLSGCFSDETEFYIITVICAPSGNALYTYLNGELQN